MLNTVSWSVRNIYDNLMSSFLGNGRCGIKFILDPAFESFTVYNALFLSRAFSQQCSTKAFPRLLCDSRIRASTPDNPTVSGKKNSRSF